LILRFAVLHRQAVGLPTFLLQLLLNPSLLAMLGLLCAPSATAALVALDVLLVRAIVDGASGALLGRSFSPGELPMTPLRDVCLGIAWAQGLASDEVGPGVFPGPGSLDQRCRSAWLWLVENRTELE
jgi:hypothetical protein